MQGQVLSASVIDIVSNFNLHNLRACVPLVDLQSMSLVLPAVVAFYKDVRLEEHSLYECYGRLDSNIRPHCTRQSDGPRSGIRYPQLFRLTFTFHGQYHQTSGILQQFTLRRTELKYATDKFRRCVNGGISVFWFEKKGQGWAAVAISR